MKTAIITREDGEGAFATDGVFIAYCPQSKSVCDGPRSVCIACVVNGRWMAESENGLVPVENFQATCPQCREVAKLLPIREAIIRVFLVRSGDGCEVDVGNTPDLLTAMHLINDLDERYEKWIAGDWKEADLDDSDPLASYEGCDIYAQNLHDGVLWTLTEDTPHWVKATT